MPRTRLDNEVTKVESKIIAPDQFSGMKQFPVDGNGNILSGVYVVEFYIDYNGKRFSKTKTYDFAYPPGIEKKIVFDGTYKTINHYSHNSDTPTVWNDMDLTLVGKTATYEKYIDGVLTVTEDVTHLITMDRSMLDPSIMSNNYMLQGVHPVLFEVHYTDLDGDVVYGTIKQNVLVKEIISTPCVDPRDGQTLTESHADYDIICGSASRWKLTWEPESLNTIEIIISDPNNPASFPTTQEMQGSDVKVFLEDLLEGDTYELQHTEIGPNPSFPNDMYVSPTTRTYTYEAINLTTTEEVVLKQSELVVLNYQLERDIRFISPEMRPTVIREVLWEPSSLTDNIVVQDHQSSSVPSAAALMQTVRAYYINEQGQEEDLSVTLKRPEQSNYPALPSQWFDSNGEINAFIPKTWNISYTAQLPGYTTSTEIFAPITSRKTKKFIIEDTVAPVFVTNNSLSFPPTQAEVGTSYDDFSTLWDPNCSTPNCVPNLYALDYPRHTAPGASYPYKKFTPVVNIMHITEERDLTEQEFDEMIHGDAFRFKAVVTDDSNNTATSFTTVNFVDTTVPTLTVNTLSISINPSSPTEQELLAGVTTSDASTPVNVSYDISGIDWNSAGVATVTYTATDAIGLQTTKDRTIIIYDPSAIPTGGSNGGGSNGGGAPVTCGDAVDNLMLNGTEILSQMTDADWAYNFYTLDDKGNQVNVDYVIHTNSKQWLIDNATNPDGTLISSGMGPTAYYFNIDVYYQGYFLHCVTRYMEIQDSIAPTVTLPPDPIEISITSLSDTDYVTSQLKNELILSDNVSSVNNITLTIGGLSNSEASTAGSYTKTVRATDEAGNYTDLSVTFELVVSDSDGDGIVDSRDQFPSDPLYTTDIDGDGAGDDDSVVIWHHDFHNTLTYLSIREAEINDTPVLNSVAQQVQYVEVVTSQETAQKRSVRMEDGFNLSTSNVDSSPVSIQDTSISFTLALESAFEIDNTDTGMFIFFDGSGNSGATEGRLEIKIKKLQQISTGNIVYRFSVYNIKQNLSTSTIHVYNNSKYSNTTGNGVNYLNATDLTDYTVLNDVGANELYLGDTSGYEIGEYITNFDLPIDNKLHAYTFAFQKRVDVSSGYQVAFYADGDLKQLLFKNDTRGLGLEHAPVTYNLNGFDSMFMSDYIWSTMTNDNDLINIHENLLVTTFPASTLGNDTDGEGLTDLAEDILGPQFDKTQANTDANLIQHHTDDTDDYVERWISKFATPLSSTTVIGNTSFTTQKPLVEDFSQDTFVNYFWKGIVFVDHLLQEDCTMAFWWLNNGTLPGGGQILGSNQAGAFPALGWDATGAFYTKNHNTSTTSTGTVTGFPATYNSLYSTEGAQWKHFAASFDYTNQEIKIYINGTLRDTIPSFTGTISQIVNRGVNVYWTDFALWGAILDQSKITQIHNRGKDLEYDLRNEYPVIVADSNPLILGFDTTSVTADYTSLLLTADLTFTGSVQSTTVNNYQLDAAISNTGSTAGIYEIAVETTSTEGLKTYTRREVVVSEPLRGFVEELPFMSPSIGSFDNMASLNFDTSLPSGTHSNIVNNPHVLIPGSEFTSITAGWTISFWHYQTEQLGISANILWSNYNFGPSGNTGIILEYYHNQFKLKAGGIQWPWVTTFTAAHGDNLNSWTHVVITLDYNDSKAKFYKNGSLEHNNSVTINSSHSPDWTKNLFLGSPMSMSIDSFEITNYVLTPTGVSNLHAAGRAVFMNEVPHSTPPIVYNHAYEPIINFPSGYRTDTELWKHNWNYAGLSLSNACNDFFTMSMWIKVDGGHGPIVASQYPSNGFLVEALASNISLHTPDGSNTLYDYPNDKDTDLTDNTFHHILVTWDHSAGSRSLWLDGAKLTGGADSFTPNSGSPNNGSIRFYKKWGAAQDIGFVGDVDTNNRRRFGNFHLINSVLSNQTIGEIHNAGYLGIIIDSTSVPSAPGSYVTDVEDGDGVITATSDWNTAIGATPSVGSHTVTYSATDSHGEATTLDVDVIVV